MINIQDTIASQYANSPIILSIIDTMNGAIDPRFTIADFYTILWNLRTATGWGLDIWGRIVGVNRTVQMLDPSAKYFGFKTTPTSVKFTPFDNAPFSGAGSGFQSYRLSDTQYKELIIIKAASNILYATAPNINKYLKSIFGDQRAYYYITGHMTASYIFEFNLTPFQRLIAFTLKLLPEPCGVLVSYQQSAVNEYFGFEGSEFQPFDQGVFLQ